MADNDAPNNDAPNADPPDAGRPTSTAADAAKRGGLPRWVKVILLLVVIAVAVVVLFTTVFPWVEERMQDPTMGAMVGPWIAYLRF